MVENSRPEGAPIALTVYPGTYHAFDVALLDPGIQTLGHRYEYNRSAATDAETKVRAFLAENLAKPDRRDERATRRPELMAGRQAVFRLDFRR
jgi:hypothetical protein